MGYTFVKVILVRRAFASKGGKAILRKQPPIARTQIQIPILLLILMLFLLPVLIAANPAAVEGPEEKRCFLWEVDSEDDPTYLLGAVHLGVADLFPLDPKIEKAYEKSSFLVVEANILDVDEEELVSLLNSCAVNPGYQSVERYISPDEYALLLEALAELNLNIEQVSFYRPWFLGNLITVARLLKTGFNPNFGIDLYFLQKASGEKDILELETVEFQYMLFSDLSPEQERLFLRDALTTTSEEEIEEYTSQLFQAWKTGDTVLMEKLLLSYQGIDAAYYGLYERIFLQRNREMAVKIEEYMQKGTCFVVVGAGHLVGEEGIVELLRKRGYTIRQL